MIISLDTETTGLNPQRHKPIAIGACTLTPEEEGHTFYRQIKWSEVLVEPKAMEINGLNLWEGIDFLQLYKDFMAWLEFIEASPTDNTLLGVNPRFDYDMLKYNPGGLFICFHYRHIDINSIIMFHDLDRKWIREKSDEMMYHFNWTGLTKESDFPIEHHHALYDAVFNVMCYRVLKEKLNAKQCLDG